MPEAERRRDVELDDALAMVGFGKFQVLMFALLLPVTIFHGARMTSTFFFVFDVEHRCALPDYPNDTYEVTTEEQMVMYNRTIPPGDSCHIYSLSHNFSYDDRNHPVNGSDYLQSCYRDQLVYRQAVLTNNAVIQLDLVCERSVLKTHAAMLLYLGAMLGGTVLGIFSDRFGRLTCLVTCVAVFLPCGIGLPWVQHFATLCVLQFLLGAASTGMFASVIVMGLELVEKRMRKIPGLVNMLFFTLGEFLLGASFYGLRDWRWVSLVISAPTAFFLSYYWLVPESLRWLMIHKKYDRVSKVLRMMASMNGSVVPSANDQGENKDLEELLTSYDGREPGEERGQVKKDSFLDMFKSRVLACRVLAVCFNWLAVNLIFYGFTLNAANLKAGDEYDRFIISAAVEIPAHLTTLMLVDKVGRKPVHCALLLLAVVTSAAAVGVAVGCDDEHYYIVAVMAMIGKFSAAGLMGTSFLWMTELFPTSVRSTGLGVGNSCARIGALVSPYIVHFSMTMSDHHLGHAMPFIVFGLVSLLAFLFDLSLPETNNRDLPDTVENAKHFGRDPAKQALLIQDKAKDRSSYESIDSN